MIKVYIYRNKAGKIFGYKINDHGDPIVCSAVSALALNTINSIEVFTDEKYLCDYEEDGGFLSLEISSIKYDHKFDDKVELLINSFVLGVESIKKEYNNDIDIIYRDVR